MSAARPPLLVNAAAGRAARGGWLERVRRSGAVDIVETGSPDDLRARLRGFVEDGAERVLVAGGDGSLHEALPLLAGSACALGIVPRGRGNDLARSLGLPLDPVRATELAVRGAARAIDLGRIGGRLFAGVGAAGFDGEVARRVRAVRRGPRGPGIYVWAVARTLLSYRAPTASLEHDRGVFEGPVTLVALANAPCYGGGVQIAPSAELDDGALDVVLVRQLSRLALLRAFPRVRRGRHLDHPAVSVTRTRAARLSFRAPLTVFGDGEPLAECGPAGVTVDVAPAALRVVAAATPAAAASPLVSAAW